MMNGKQLLHAARKRTKWHARLAKPSFTRTSAADDLNRDIGPHLVKRVNNTVPIWLDDACVCVFVSRTSSRTPAFFGLTSYLRLGLLKLSVRTVGFRSCSRRIVSSRTTCRKKAQLKARRERPNSYQGCWTPDIAAKDVLSAQKTGAKTCLSVACRLGCSSKSSRCGEDEQRIILRGILTSLKQLTAQPFGLDYTNPLAEEHTTPVDIFRERTTSINNSDVDK